MEINWRCIFFDNLSVHELYAIIRLRIEVFSIEQNCIYQDADNKDQYCYHLIGFCNNELVAYARILPEDVAFKEISIGRIITSPNARRKGAGKALMIKALKICRELFGKKPVKIGAQLYLKKFYEFFGFIQCSEVYSEDGIPHIEMILMNA